MDIVGKRAKFQHINGVDDPWNGLTVLVEQAMPGGWYRVSVLLAAGQGGTRIEHLALREELTIEEGS